MHDPGRPRTLSRPIRFLIVVVLVLLSAGATSAQRRDTICLDLASSNVCTDLAIGHNTAERRLSQSADGTTQRLCRSVLAGRFAAACAARFLNSKTDRDCHAFFKRQERTYRRDVRAIQPAGFKAERCS
jgi:hypothetical protein